jgi:peroxiredoxin
LEALHRYYGRRLEVLGVDLTAEEVHPGGVASFARSMGVTYPILLDTSGQVADTYLVHGIPTSVVVNRSGIVTSVIQGDANIQEIRSAIRSALGGA